MGWGVGRFLENTCLPTANQGNTGTHKVPLLNAFFSYYTTTY